MALILPVNGVSPQFGNHNWQAPNATIVGDVQFGDYCTIWFNAVIRGDVNKIRIGHHSNIQDGAVIHCTYQKTETTIGNYVSIAHNAIVHGCAIEDSVLVGMGAIIMDGAYIETGSIIAAGAVVLKIRVCLLVVFMRESAKLLKSVSPEAAEIFMRTAMNYIEYAAWFEK